VNDLDNTKYRSRNDHSEDFNLKTYYS